MQEPYQGEPYQEDVYYEPEPQKKMSGWVIALIVIAVLIVVCCCCVFLVFFVGPLVFGPSIGNVFSTVIEAMTVTPVP
jgi:hypothetical protein